MSSGENIRDERLKKLELLKLAGMDPYPVATTKDTDVADFAARFADLSASATPITLAGRVMSKRGQGGIMFVDLFDGTDKAQVVIQKGEIDDALFELFSAAVDTGDFIEITGTAYITNRGHNSLKASRWKMLAKSLSPIPDQWFGLKDEEAMLRQRYLSILLDEDLREMFERRAHFWRTIREFLHQRGFVEVETPVLETSPGGAEARPFVTKHNALDIEVFLRISLELWQKRLLVAGFPKVFEIGRIFRNEGQSREHLQDYMQLETYEAFSDMHKGMQFTKDLYRHIANEVYGKYTFEIADHTVNLADEWPLIDFCEVLEKEYGINPATCSEKEAIQAARDAKVELGEKPNKARAVDNLWKKLRKTIAGPAFLIGVPVYLEPLAKRSTTNPNVVERFQVLIAGSEMGKGFSELNDPQDQRARFEEQQQLREAGDDEAQRLDEDYVKAMEYGMPPAFGFGVSERLFSFLENKPIHEAQLFPLLRPKK